MRESGNPSLSVFHVSLSDEKKPEGKKKKANLFIFPFLMFFFFFLFIQQNYAAMKMVGPFGPAKAAE